MDESYPWIKLHMPWRDGALNAKETMKIDEELDLGPWRAWEPWERFWILILGITIWMGVWSLRIVSYRYKG